MFSCIFWACLAIRIRVFVSALFLWFLGLLGKDLRTHNLTCACRPDYVCIGLFLRV